MRPLLWLSVAGLVVSGAAASAVAEPVTAHVHVLDTLPIPSFAPADVTIAAGSSVEWDNHAGRVHTVTHDRCPRIDQRHDPDGCVFDTLRDRGDDLGTGDTFRVRFSSPGLFTYVCAIHRFGGTITVLGDGDSLPNLAVESVRAAPTPLGTSRRIEAELVNRGEGFAPGSRLHFAYRPSGAADWVPFGDVPIDPLGPGARLTVSQDWTTVHRLGDYEVRAVADGANTVLESNEADNATHIVVSVLLPPGTLPGTPLPDPPRPTPLATP